MRKIFLFAVSLFSLPLIHAQTALDRPKLVIGIVVDQMRWDYLYRFRERYGDDGFKRLMRDGFNCEQARINYLPSYTAPGHTAIYTGAVPALNGIVANDWIDRGTGKIWYCTEDTSVESVGGGKAGMMSPRNLLATTVSDELRLATNFHARVFGIALKDRAAILPAGHTANAAFWYDKDNGRFISSSYYIKTLPAWLRDFNNRKLPDSLMRQDWKTLYPLSTYVQSTADKNAYEGRLKEDSQPVFPHKTALAVELKDYEALCYAPQGNTLTRMMAEACISGEKLGRGQTTDFLALSFSATDYIGHLYGPNSIEIEDTYLKLDKEIALFLHYLDKTVGKGKYVLFLTADHGAVHNAGFLSDHNIPARSVSIKAINKKLNAHLEQEFGYASLVRSLMNCQVFLNEPLISSKNLDREKIRQEIIRWLKGREGVTAVLDMESPERNSAPALLEAMAANGYFYQRCGSIQIILNPGWYSGYARTGTTHGSWNPYDTHIPLIWYGMGIQKGKSFKPVQVTDIAATLCALLRIQMPDACIGKVIEGLME